MQTFLLVQWMRIHLPMQGTWVWPLVQEDSTCHRAAKPGTPILSPHSKAHEPQYWVRILQPSSHNYWAHEPRAWALQPEKPPQWEACAPVKSSPHWLQLEKAHMQQQRPSTAKSKNKLNKFLKNSPSNSSRIHNILRAHKTFSRIDQMLGHKTSLHKVKLLKSNQVLFLTTNGMKMEINSWESWKFHK